jgi:V8-like Glu-specific endopeptidase
MSGARHGLLIWILVVGCAGDGGDPASRLRQAIHHGRAANDPAVPALVERRKQCEEMATTVVCSGVLVAESVVLTAAHCVPGSPRDALEVRWGGADAAPTAYQAIVASELEPRYERQYDDHDLALVWLDQPANAGPVALPGPLVSESLVGEIARVVGFGEAGGAGGSPGEELEGAVRITAVGGTTLTYEPATAMTCRGDSGGPVYVEVDGVRTLVGITTSGDEACERIGVAVRVDAHQADFISPALSRAAPTVAGPGRCRASPSGGCQLGRAGLGSWWLFAALWALLRSRRRQR